MTEASWGWTRKGLVAAAKAEGYDVRVREGCTEIRRNRQRGVVIFADGTIFTTDLPWDAQTGRMTVGAVAAWLKLAAVGAGGSRGLIGR